jgi:S-adenosylmethionine:diacylglycerol 3-amino-3-carboxypropyl transferase
MQHNWYKNATIARDVPRIKTTFIFNPINSAHLAITKLEMDLLGPLPPTQGNLRYVVVAVKCFSKWIEAKPLATITLATVLKFY